MRGEISKDVLELLEVMQPSEIIPCSVELVVERLTGLDQQAEVILNTKKALQEIGITIYSERLSERKFSVGGTRQQIEESLDLPHIASATQDLRYGPRGNEFRALLERVSQRSQKPERQ